MSDERATSGKLVSAAGRWVQAGVVVIGGARLALRAFSDVNPRTLFFAAPDDAFYYLQIAWNLSRGLGSTFDGIHATNGYQPAWCVLLALLARLVPTREALLDASIGVTCVLHVAAGMVLARVASSLFSFAMPSLLLTLWLLGPQLESFIHLEAPLNVLALALLLAAAVRAHRRRGVPGAARGWLAMGLAAALASLTRLDNVMLLPPLALWVWHESPRGTRIGVATWVLGPTALALGLYAALNTIYVGAPLPVSGTLKAGMQLSELRDLLLVKGPSGLPGFVGRAVTRAIAAGPSLFVSAWFDREPWRGAPLAVLVPALVALLAWLPLLASSFARNEAARRLWLAFAAGVTCHFVFMLAMVGTFPREWHWMPEAVLLVLTLSFVVPGAIRVLTTRFGAASDALACVATGALAVTLAIRATPGISEAWHGLAWGHLVSNDQIRMSRHWDGLLPPKARVGAWNAGYLAYFSDLQVVNLDGLVNAPDFAKRIEGDRWLAYCQEEGIRYVADTWGGAFDLLARDAQILDRRTWGGPVEYVLLEIPEPAR